MKDFPRKIVLSQDSDSKEILDEWVLNDFTDNKTQTYVPLNTVCEYLKPLEYQEYAGGPIVRLMDDNEIEKLKGTIYMLANDILN